MKGIMNLIDKAYKLYQSFGQALFRDKGLNTLLQKLNQNIMATKNHMVLTGVAKECADYAVNGEGTCFSTRTGYKCNSILMLLNLLLGNPPVIQKNTPVSTLFCQNRDVPSQHDLLSVSISSVKDSTKIFPMRVLSFYKILRRRTRYPLHYRGAYQEKDTATLI